MDTDMLTIEETARELHVSDRVVKDLCRNGRLAYSRVNHRTWLISRAEIKAFLERSTRPATAAKAA